VPVTQKRINLDLHALAKRLEGDISARGLQPGDRYRTAAEAGLMLGVSAATAHRAMNLLVEKALLTREQGRGTFVGAGADHGKGVRLRVVYVLLEADQKSVTSVQLEDIIEAVRGRFQDANVQFCFVPEERGVEYVRAFIGSSQRAGHYAGAIPISCSREVYRYLGDVGGPVVVLGSLYPDQQHLASVDIDYRQAGRIMAQRLISRGHRRMALLTTGGGRPGDNALFDGISDAITEARLPHNALIVRIFPHDFESFRAQTRELLERPDRPSGIMCASDRLVKVVAAVAAESGLSLGTDLELIFQGQSKPEAERLPYPRVQPRMSFSEIAELVAEMLAQQSAGESLREKRVVISVELHDPS